MHMGHINFKGVILLMADPKGATRSDFRQQIIMLCKTSPDFYQQLLLRREREHFVVFK